MSDLLLDPVDVFLDGTVSLAHMPDTPPDHDQLLQRLDETHIKLSSLFPDMKTGLDDHILERHPTIKHNQTEDARDPVSVEFVYHFDGACEPAPLRPMATLAVAREAGVNAPATQFVSTAGFLTLARELGVFDNFDPAYVDSVFGYSAYYDQFQRMLVDLEPKNPRLQEIVRADFERFGVKSREELVEVLDTHPLKGKRRLPLIDKHSTTGEEWITIDGGARNIGLLAMQGYEDQVEQHDLDTAFKWLRLLLDDTNLLKGEGLIAEIPPRTGFAVAFSREGLHRQMIATNNGSQKAKRQMSIVGLIKG